MLGWTPSSGIYLGMIMVALYSFSGGILCFHLDRYSTIYRDDRCNGIVGSRLSSSSSTDFLTVCIIGKYRSPSIRMDTSRCNTRTHTICPRLVFGWFGGIGQPHIIIRAMTLDDPQNIQTMRRTYFFGISSSVFSPLLLDYTQKSISQNMEIFCSIRKRHFPFYRQSYFLPFSRCCIGITFAATMSTADSQVLASSASLTQDVWTEKKNDYLVSKICNHRGSIDSWIGCIHRSE